MKEKRVCLLGNRCDSYEECKKGGGIFFVKKCIICHEEINIEDELSPLVTLVFVDEKNVLYAGKGEFNIRENIRGVDKYCGSYIFRDKFLELGDITKIW